MRRLMLVALLLWPGALLAQDDEPPDGDDPILEEQAPATSPAPLPTPAPGVPAPTAPPAGIIGVAGRTVDGAVLIGQGGELYHRIDGAWRRRHGGGVAAPLVAATGAGPDAIWAVADAPPIYRHDGRSWLAESLPVTAGPAVLAPGSPAALLVGRRAVVRDGARWKPIRARNGPACERAVTAEAQILALCGGQLELYDGRAWTELSVRPPVTIIALAAGKRLHALTSSGGVLTVAGRRLQRSRPGAESAMTASLAGAAPGGKVHVIAHEASGPSTRWHLLVEESGRLARHDTLPLTGDADPPRLLFMGSDGLLVVTMSGKVLVRATDGTWKTEQVERALPVPPAPPRNPPARAG